jgi:hypothetical protein
MGKEVLGVTACVKENVLDHARVKILLCIVNRDTVSHGTSKWPRIRGIRVHK